MNWFALSAALLVAAYIALHYWSVYKPAADAEDGDRGAPQASDARPDIRDSRNRTRQAAITTEIISGAQAL